MIVSRFIFEFWRTGVSVDNRRFCPILWQKVRQKCRVENRFFVRFLRQNFRISIRKYSVIVASLCVGAILSVRQTVGSRQIVNVEL